MLLSGAEAEIDVTGVSAVRFIPSGVKSKIHDKMRATGNPRATSTTIIFTTQVAVKNGKTWVSI